MPARSWHSASLRAARDPAIIEHVDLSLECFSDFPTRSPESEDVVCFPVLETYSGVYHGLILRLVEGSENSNCYERIGTFKSIEWRPMKLLDSFEKHEFLLV